MFKSSSFFGFCKDRVVSRFYLLYKVEMIGGVYLPILEWVKISNKFLFFTFWKLVWDVLCFVVSLDCLFVLFCCGNLCLFFRWMRLGVCWCYEIFVSYCLFCHFFFVGVDFFVVACVYVFYDFFISRIRETY